MDRYVGMENVDLNPDTIMIAAGFVISLITALELYPEWKQARNDSHGSSVRGNDRVAAEK